MNDQEVQEKKINKNNDHIHVYSPRGKGSQPPGIKCFYKNMKVLLILIFAADFTL